MRRKKACRANADVDYRNEKYFNEGNSVEADATKLDFENVISGRRYISKSQSKCD